MIPVKKTAARPRKRSQLGSSMLELALSFSVFFAFLFGIIEFGRAAWTYNLTCYLAHEGARYAMVRGSSSGAPVDAAAVSTYVKSLAAGIDPATITVSTTWPVSNSNVPGNPVQVQVFTNFRFVAPVSPAASGGPVTMALSGISMGSTSKMTIAQ